MMYKRAYITAMSYILPGLVEENTDERLREKTGILRRHICLSETTAADMAQNAAERLFCGGVNRQAVDFLLLCTQSPDYPLPTTACILQDKLGIPKSAGAFDFNLGCSGYIYGLGIAKGLIETGQAKCVLLLTAETYSKYICPEDSATRSLFGDAATATLIECVDSPKEGIHSFVYGTDGSGAENLIVPIGGARNPYGEHHERDGLDNRGREQTSRTLRMNGMGIMNFALQVCPETVESILRSAGLQREQIDYFVFHQANHFMLVYLRKQCKLLEYPYWNDVGEYGNTVSNSLPMAICDLVEKNGNKSFERVMLIGFGVGLSWGGCIVDLGRVKILKENYE